MAYGEGIAQSFQIPFPQQQTAPVQRAAGEPKERELDLKSMGLEAPAFDLQSTSNVGDRMAQYYRDFADLQKFAKTMWKNYKIDVQAPDPTNELAVRASETFAEMVANLWETQNLAKNSEIDRRKMYEAQLQGNVEAVNPLQQGQFLNQVDPSQQFSSNKLPEWLTVAGASTGETVDNSRDYNRKIQEWQVLHNEVKRRLDANPNNLDLQKQYQAVLTMKPSFNVEAKKDDNKGRTFLDAGLEELALMSEGSSRYYTPTDKFDSGGGRILRSDKFKGKTIGRRDASGKQVGFIVDHVEYRPGEGGMVFVDAAKNVIPVSEMGIVETYANINDVPKTQLYKHIGERYGTDVLSSRDFISKENLPTLANNEELMTQAPEIAAKREQAAAKLATGDPNYFNFWTVPFKLPWNKNITVKNPSTNQEVEIRRDSDDLVSVSASDWKKIAGSSEGTITVGNQIIDKKTAANGIPKELMLKVLELTDFAVPGMETDRASQIKAKYELK